MKNIRTGIKIETNTYKTGNTAKDIIIVDKEYWFEEFAMTYVYNSENLAVYIEYIGEKYYLYFDVRQNYMSLDVNRVKILESSNGIGLKIYQISKYVYFMVTWTNTKDKNSRSKKTLQMFRIEPYADTPTVVLGKGLDICAANTTSDMNDAFLLASLSAGNMPNEFMIYRINQKTETNICTYYCMYLYMNLATLALSYPTSNSNPSWTTIGADTTYNVNLPYGQDIENSYAYILRQTISNNAVSAYYLLSRNEGVLNKTVADSSMYRVTGKTNNKRFIFQYYLNPTYERTNIGFLDEATGKLMIEA